MDNAEKAFARSQLEMLDDECKEKLNQIISLKASRKSPYFGSIDFKIPNELLSYRIGLKGIKEDGKIISYNHERAGLKLVRKFLKETTYKDENNLRNYILNMTELHMQPNQLANQNSKLKSTRKLFAKSVCPQDLILLAKADALGRTVEQNYSLKEEYLINGLNDYLNNKEINKNDKL